MSGKVTVLLVDDHAMVRRGFRRILEDEPQITVVGEASDGAEAIQMVRELEPHVVVMDCAMPRLDGFQATREIIKTRPEIAVLMLSMHSEGAAVQQALDAGARGYILKNAMELDLASAIKQVAAGARVIDPKLTAQPAPTGGRDCKLSTRELEVLQLIVDGKSTREIAAQLGVSQNTVGAHRGNIMRELGIHRTAELVVYAIRKRLVNIP
jgi:DNA-binding NarL/FixJ family response regulator